MHLTVSCILLTCNQELDSAKTFFQTVDVAIIIIVLEGSCDMDWKVVF